MGLAQEGGGRERNMSPVGHLPTLRLRRGFSSRAAKTHCCTITLGTKYYTLLLRMDERAGRSLKRAIQELARFFLFFGGFVCIGMIFILYGGVVWYPRGIHVIDGRGAKREHTMSFVFAFFFSSRSHVVS